MIKIYVYNRFNGTYGVTVVDEDLPLFTDIVEEYDLWGVIESLKVDFSDTGREIRIFEN